MSEHRDCYELPRIHVQYCCASYVLHTHDVIDDVTRSISRSNLKIAITKSVFVVQSVETNCHNLWFTGRLSNTLNFRFQFQFETWLWVFVHVIWVAIGVGNGLPSVWYQVMGLFPDMLRMRRECRERFPRHWLQRKPLVSDPGMHHGTRVTHVPWCMSGSLTRAGREHVPGIPDACRSRNFTCLATGPLPESVFSYCQLRTQEQNSVKFESKYKNVLQCRLLTHGVWVTHVFVSKLNIIDSDNGLPPGRRQAIIWINAGILLIWPSGTSFSEMLIEIQTFSFNKMHLKLSSETWPSVCLGPNVLNIVFFTHPIYWFVCIR